MAADWKPVAAPSASLVRPDQSLVGVIGWEFIVPDDPDVSDDDLLAEAVRLAQNKKFREKRRAFYEFSKKATRDNLSDKQFTNRLEVLLGRYNEETAKTRVKRTAVNAFKFLGAGGDIADAAEFFEVIDTGVPYLKPIGPSLSAAAVFVETFWKPSVDSEKQAVAMFHDARRHFGWQEASRI
jgi:hypothetical protein